MNSFVQRSQLRDLYDKVAAGERISEADALRLFESKDLNALGAIADLAKRLEPELRATLGPIAVAIRERRMEDDLRAARSAGLPATTISCRGRLDHVPARVDRDALERAGGFCIELIQRLDAEVGADLAAPVEETVLTEAEDS